MFVVQLLTYTTKIQMIQKLRRSNFKTQAILSSVNMPMVKLVVNSHIIADLPVCLLCRTASSFVEVCCWWWWWWWWWCEPECRRSCRCCSSDSDGLRLPSRRPSSLSSIGWPRCTCSAGRSRMLRSSCRCFASASFNRELWLLTAVCSERPSLASRSFTDEDWVCNLQWIYNQLFKYTANSSDTLRLLHTGDTTTSQQISEIIQCRPISWQFSVSYISHTILANQMSSSSSSCSFAWQNCQNATFHIQEKAKLHMLSVYIQLHTNKESDPQQHYHCDRLYLPFTQIRACSLWHILESLTINAVIFNTAFKVF